MNSAYSQSAWILLPGFDGTGLLFDAFLRAIPAEINRVVVRYPCDRVCTAEELLNLVLEKIPASVPYVLIAESFSGPLALRAAAFHSHPPAAIVLCASFAKCPVPRFLTSLAAAIASPLARYRLPKFLVRHSLVGDAPERLVEQFRAALSTVSPRVFGQRFNTLGEFDEAFAPTSLGIPLLYLMAGRDRIVGRRSLEWLRARYPHVVVETLASPHFVLQCRPEAAYGLITEFLASLPPCQHNVSE